MFLSFCSCRFRTRKNFSSDWIDFLEDSECLVDIRHGLLRIKDEKILMRREFAADDRIVEQKEQVNSDEPKIAAEITEPRDVASPRESSPLSETSSKTRTP